MSLNVIPVPALRDNYIWCVHDTETNGCVIVDPGEAEPALEVIDNYHLKPQGILITHYHGDHSGGIKPIVKRYNIEVYGAKNSQVRHCTKQIDDGESIHFDQLNLSLSVFSIPCHTKDHIAFYGQGMVFTGDTLFTGGCGKFFEGTAEDMYNALTKLAMLPLETNIYCGHEYTEKNLRFALEVEPDNQALHQRYQRVHEQRQQGQPTVPATLETELKTNPFMRTGHQTVQRAVHGYVNRQLDDNIDVLAALRQWKDEIG